MSEKIKYTNEPLGTPRTIPDFLPPPNELAFKEDTVKVTITLSRFSVEFFKQEAEKHGTKYQQMIRRLLDIYAQSQQRSIHDRHAGEKVTRKTPQKR